jgi:hypothetical protein
LVTDADWRHAVVGSTLWIRSARNARSAPRGRRGLRREGFDPPDGRGRSGVDEGGVSRQSPATEFEFVVPIDGTWDDELGEPHVLAGAIDRLAVRHYLRKPVVAV